ncbi:hypothetical protein MGN70_007074 [Eutypa lata]|nr:hypothetical protein MGN70_007074 [Eutypa lata]
MKLYVEASSSSAGTRPLRLSSPFHISLRRSRQLSSQRGLKIRYYQRMAVYDWPQSLNVGISSSGDKTLAHDWDVLGTSRCYSNGVRKAGRRTPVVARTELESYTRFRAPLNLGRMQPDATGRAFLPPREDVEGFSNDEAIAQQNTLGNANSDIQNDDMVDEAPAYVKKEDNDALVDEGMSPFRDYSDDEDISPRGNSIDEGLSPFRDDSVDERKASPSRA